MFASIEKLLIRLGVTSNRRSAAGDGGVAISGNRNTVVISNQMRPEVALAGRGQFYATSDSSGRRFEVSCINAGGAAAYDVEVQVFDQSGELWKGLIASVLAPRSSGKVWVSYDHFKFQGVLKLRIFYRDIGQNEYAVDYALGVALRADGGQNVVGYTRVPD